MSVDLEIRQDIGLLMLRVIGHPAEGRHEGVRQEVLDLLAGGAVQRLALDLRRQSASVLSGPTVRSMLVSYDRVLSRFYPDPDDALHVAIISQPGSFGQGIARMLLGHAWGLDHLRLSQFDTPEEAAPFLGLPEDWDAPPPS